MKALYICLLLGMGALTAIPAAAAPWCADYCNCNTSCFARCYDETGATYCDAYICDEFCQGASGLETSSTAGDELLDAIFAPAEAPEAEAGEAAADSVPEIAAAPTC